MLGKLIYRAVFFGAAAIACCRMAAAQSDLIKTGTGIGQERTRMAVSSFFAGPENADITRVFDDTLWNDLDNSGILDLASKSMYPLSLPSRPTDLRLEEWRDPPLAVQMVVVGNLSRSGDQAQINGWLVDPRNPAQSIVLGKRYSDKAENKAVQHMAHQFADEIIFLLGGGIPGIAESRIAYVRMMAPKQAGKTAVKEIWMMDYDGGNQEQITHLNTLCLTPAISTDGTQIAFTTYLKGNPDIMVLSLLSKTPLSFFNRKGLNTTPTWSPDGTKLAFTSSVTGDPEIYMGDVRGNSAKRLTYVRGVDIEPAWNPKTGAQIAFVSDRSGHPMIYMMDSEGANVTQLVDGGTQALDPAWSPNGRLLAFTWNKDEHYDIYLMDVATREIVQLTKDSGRNEHPSWSPDNRHIVFQSNRAGGTQVWSMLADGSKQRRLTAQGENTEPVWSNK